MNDRIEIRLFFVGLLLIVGLFARAKKIQLPLRLSLIFRKIFIYMCFFVLLIFIFSLFGIYFQGYWTTKTIIWIFVSTTSLYYSFGNRQTISKPWELIAMVLFYLPITTIALLFIPTYIGNILTYAMWLRLTGDTSAIYYNDKDIRIEKVCSDCDAGFKGDPEYFQKKGIFEFDRGYLRTGNNMFDDRIKVEKTKDSITVYLFYTNQEPVPFKFDR